MTDKKRREEDGDELVALISVQGEMNAQVLVGVLQSENIEVMLKSPQAFAALPFSVDGMGEVRLMVRRRDLHRARLVLEEYRAAGADPMTVKMLVDWDPPGEPS
jgi:hypothetical protein